MSAANARKALYKRIAKDAKTVSVKELLVLAQAFELLGIRKDDDVHPLMHATSGDLVTFGEGAEYATEERGARLGFTAGRT